MLIRRKRSRAEAFKEELTLGDDSKKTKCTLVAQGVRAGELRTRIRELADRRKARQGPRKNEALERARAAPRQDRAKARAEDIMSMRAHVSQTTINGDEDHPIADLAMDEAIFLAFTQRNFEVGLRLVEHDRKVNSTRKVDGTTLLMAACLHGDKEVAFRLLELGADPDQRDLNDNSPKEFARMQKVDAQMEATLLELLENHEYVYDLYEVDDDFLSAEGRFNLHSVEGMLMYDDASGQFVELAHFEDDDFGRNGDDSDSNSSGYYERHMEDNSEDGEKSSCDSEDGCALNRKLAKEGAHEDLDEEVYMDDGYMGDN
jgi:hypothetical protein